MSFDEPPVNPFRNTAALCPWEEDSEDEEMYVAVDHTAEQYRRFVDYLGKPGGDIRARGRLIVVTGERGSGKTSLIHRCVNQLKRHVQPGELRIADVTRDERLPSGNHPEPPDNYLDRLTHHVLTEMTAYSEHFADPGPIVVNAASAYSKLSQVLRVRSEVAAVLLPPFDDQVSSPAAGGDAPVAVGWHPIREYMRLRHRGIVFFAESHNPAAIDAWYQKLDNNGKSETLVLRLEALRPGDGWLFASERLGKVRHDDRVPRIREDTMRNLLANSRSKITLSHLSELCRDLWDLAILNQRREITEDDISQVYNARADLYQRRPGRDDGGPGRRPDGQDR